MTKLELTKAAIAKIDKEMNLPFATATPDAFILAMLSDIAMSLAMIADKMPDKEDKNNV